MYAVVDIAGQQFKVKENEKYYVPRLETEADKDLTFDSVHILFDGKNTEVGTPFIDGAKVEVKVLDHVKDDKVIVFKKKRRKSYKKTNGHRQHLTQIEVTKIGK